MPSDKSHKVEPIPERTIMFLRYTFDSPIVRDEDCGFIRHHDVDVFSYGDDGEYLIGRVAFDMFLWGDAETARASLFDICDADSQGWYEVFHALSGRATFGDGGRDEILPEMGITDVVDSVTFIWHFLLHPEARPSCTKAIIHDIARYARVDSLLTTWHSTLDLSDGDLIDMGFAKIGGSQLIFADLHHQYPYDARHPGGEDIDFEARPEHEKWVLEHWGV